MWVLVVKETNQYFKKHGKIMYFNSLQEAKQHRQYVYDWFKKEQRKAPELQIGEIVNND